MLRLQKLDASLRVPTTVGRVNVDLILADGCSVPLQTDRPALDMAIDASYCSMLRLEAPDVDYNGVVLVSDWLHPWRSGKIVLVAIEADEEVSVYSHVILGKVPRCVFAGESSLKTLTPWIQAMGRADSLFEPLTVEFDHRTSDGIVIASHVKLPVGCRLLSSPDQPLYEVESDRKPWEAGVCA